MESKAWMARAMALALLVPAASACNKADKTEETIEVKTEEAPPAAPVTITINPLGGGTVMGDLAATHEADKTVVRLNLSGLTDGKDYKAKIRYGDCAVAASYDGKDKAPKPSNPPPANATSPTPGAAPEAGMAPSEHKVGDEVTDIHIDHTGATGTGTADLDNKKLGADEAAYVVVLQDDMIVGCGDLRGHGEMGAPMGGTEPAPGAAMPSDTGKK